MKKRLIIAAASAVIIVAAVTLVFKFCGIGTAGIDYSQKDSGYYLQLKNNGTFNVAYNPKKDDDLADKSQNANVEAYIDGSGTWSKDGNKIALKFDNGTVINLVKGKKYIYNADAVYKGIVSDEKAFSQIFTYRYPEDENKYDSVIFFDDLTMSFNRFRGVRPTSHAGRYTRVDDIITVRYNDEDNKAHKFLIVEGGITDDIYLK